MIKVATRWVCFGDEATSIGSGWRKVDILSVGRKWVYLRSHYDTLQNRTKLRLATWHKIEAAPANIRGHPTFG